MEIQLTFGSTPGFLVLLALDLVPIYENALGYYLVSEDRLRLCFKEEDVDTILKIHNGLRPGVDWWIWTRPPNGRFSVSLAYNCVVNEGLFEESQKEIRPGLIVEVKDP